MKIADKQPTNTIAPTHVPPSPHAAFVAMQAELTNPPKTKTAKGKTFSYKYSDLAGTIDHIREVMAKHGFAYSQGPGVQASGQGIYATNIFHTTGLYLHYEEPMPAFGDPQDKGIWTTYARRYQLLAAIGITGDDDTDGADVAPEPPAKATYRPADAPKPAATPRVTPPAPLPPKPAQASTAKDAPAANKYGVTAAQRRAIFETASIQCGMGDDAAISWLRQVSKKASSEDWNADDVKTLQEALETWK